MIPAGFKGRAVRLTDIDVARCGRLIGTGEDEIRAVIEVETAGGGFDWQGRPRMLFEPHVFWRELGAGPKRMAAEEQGLAYPKWKAGSYPSDSYPRLAQAMRLDPNAALRSCSWGLGQIMGFNHKAAGYASAGDLVVAFCDSEKAGLEAMIRFIQSEGLDDELRRHDWSGFARGYNGAGYATHGYHIRLAAAFAKWQRIPDAIDAAHPNIGLGARGKAVRLAQKRLRALGFDPEGVDGIFGADTYDATIAFQTSVGLTPDGIIGPKTWAVLTPELETA
ncbi:N-acetylmuramidase domain-containing protein [Falsirhodobacter sp. 20TX0035]|uniref:N-acetylmuramidase domain-containing protein n=1 Tax=Falsirhodobacter sp. 20TX0035 TaxID=3022019 RepID=UPI00232D9B45|nr:N-acetylmuramidase domain-containing protein [Falsirhodobacter sp. 20TX0035]MDB6454837.1 N-acetylmuramidase domain-containing protein [Falsirhodobacter sp. 20TX0035]